MFAKWPNLKFIHTMFGGNWFALQDLLAPHKSTKKKEAMNRLAPMSAAMSTSSSCRTNVYFDANPSDELEQ
jgi:hypothetical protein